MRGHRDLAFACRAALASAALGLLIPIGWLSFIAAAPLFFALPGYAITSLAFARRSRGLAPLIALTLGLSLAVLVLGSLLVSALPGGLRAGWWAALLVVVTLAASWQAALRRDPGHRISLPAMRPPRLATGAIALLAGGLVLAALAIAIGFVTFKAPNAVGFTELWISPRPADAIRVGVGSQEQERRSYRLEVRVPGDAAPVERRLSLDPGQTKVLRVPLPGQPPARAQRVVALLYQAGTQGRPYRRVNAWIGGGG